MPVSLFLKEKVSLVCLVNKIELKMMFLILPFVEGSDSDGDLNGGHGCGREGPWKVRTFVDNQTFLALPPQNHPTTQIIIWLILLLLTLNTNIWCWFTIHHHKSHLSSSWNYLCWFWRWLMMFIEIIANPVCSFHTPLPELGSLFIWLVHALQLKKLKKP